jgi:hypothetical protein
MSAVIQNHTSLPAMPQPYDSRHCCHESREFSYQEKKSAAISITTDEGDVITLSSAGRRQADFALDYWQDDSSRLMNFTSKTLAAESFSLSVQGDLNDEELNDIASLMENLNNIAGDFFSGNLDEALSGALNIGDMGSVANLSATFSHTLAMNSTSLSENHPLPAIDQHQERFNDFKEILNREQPEEISYAEMMRAQWQQIKNFIENIQQDSEQQQDKQIAATDNKLNHADKMLEKINNFTGHHPRLAAFAAPLAHQAVNQAADKYPSYHSSGMRNQFNHDIMEKINNWMMA